MTLEDLRIFVAVAEATSMGEVARAVGRSQPAVAQHVRRLEREMGAILVHRHSRGASLTDAGRILYERATLVLRALASAREDIEAASGRPNDTLAFSASAATTRDLLQPAILELRRRVSNLRLHMHVGATVEQRLDAVRERRVDLAFITLAGPRSGFDLRPVVEMPLLLLVNREDPLARRRRLPLKALERIRYVALEGSSTIDFVQRHLEAQGARVEPVQTVASAETAILHVELGLGHTFIPAVQAPSVLHRGRVHALRVTGLPAVPLGWAALDFGLLPSVAKAFLGVADRHAHRWSQARLFWRGG